MKQLIKVILLSPILILTACFSEKDEDIVHQDFDHEHLVPADETPPVVDTIQWISSEAIKMSFDSVTIYLDSLEFFTDSTLNSNDTIYIDLELGSSLASHYFKVETLFDSAEVVVLHQFETSITVQNEGPHCDLVSWKHYYSAPDTLALVDSTGTFQFKNVYEDSLTSEFPNVKMKDVLKAVKLHCGKEWYDHAKTAKNVNSYPLSVSVSKEIIKILILNRNRDVIHEKVLIFYVPMGC